MKKAIAGIFGATWITLAGSASAATQLTSLSEASEALRELPQGAITQQILDPIELESTRGGMVPLSIDGLLLGGLRSLLRTVRPIF